MQIKNEVTKIFCPLNFSVCIFESNLMTWISYTSIFNLQQFFEMIKDTQSTILIKETNYFEFRTIERKHTQTAPKTYLVYHILKHIPETNVVRNEMNKTKLKICDLKATSKCL